MFKKAPFKIMLLSLLFAVTGSWAGEDDLYNFLWLDPDKSVHVLQNKLYPKKKKFFFDLGYVSSSSSVFQDTKGAQLKGSYFFNENWGIELSYTQYTSLNNSTFEGVKYTSGTIPYIIKPLENISLFLTWSPFYGKINTFNKIYYFDWSFSIGSGQYKIQSNLDSVIDPGAANTFNEETKTPVQLKTSFKFHVNDSVYLGVEYLNTNFTAGTPKEPSADSWQSSNDLIFNVGFLSNEVYSGNDPYYFQLLYFGCTSD